MIISETAQGYSWAYSDLKFTKVKVNISSVMHLPFIDNPPLLVAKELLDVVNSEISAAGPTASAYTAFITSTPIRFTLDEQFV